MASTTPPAWRLSYRSVWHLNPPLSFPYLLPSAAHLARPLGCAHPALLLPCLAPAQQARLQTQQGRAAAAPAARQGLRRRKPCAPQNPSPCGREAKSCKERKMPCTAGWKRHVAACRWGTYTRHFHPLTAVCATVAARPTWRQCCHPHQLSCAALSGAPPGAQAGLTARRQQAGRAPPPRCRGPAAARAAAAGPEGRWARQGRGQGLGCLAGLARSSRQPCGCQKCMLTRCNARPLNLLGSRREPLPQRPALRAAWPRSAVPGPCPLFPPTWRSASPSGPSAAHSAQCVLQNSANTWHSSSAASSAPGAPLARSAAARAGSAPASCRSSGCSSSEACSMISVAASTAAGSSRGWNGCPRAASLANSSSPARLAK